MPLVQMVVTQAMVKWLLPDARGVYDGTRCTPDTHAALQQYLKSALPNGAEEDR